MKLYLSIQVKVEGADGNEVVVEDRKKIIGDNPLLIPIEIRKALGEGVTAFMDKVHAQEKAKRRPMEPARHGEDAYGAWVSKHNNGYRAPEVVYEMECKDPTLPEERLYVARDGRMFVRRSEL